MSFYQPGPHERAVPPPRSSDTLPPFRHLDPDAYGAAQVLTTIGTGTGMPPYQQHPVTASALHQRAAALQQDPLLAGMQAESCALPSTQLPLVHTSDGSAHSVSMGFRGFANGSGMTSVMTGPTLSTAGQGGHGQLDRALRPTLERGKRRYEGEGEMFVAMSPVGRKEGTDSTATAIADSPSTIGGSALTSAPPPPAKTAATFKPEFQFVVNEDAKQARKTVRKHVMREYRRRERFEQGIRKEKPVPTSKTANGTEPPKQGQHMSPAPIKCESPSSESTIMGAGSPRTPDHDEKIDMRNDTSTISVTGNKRRRGSPKIEEVDVQLALPSPDDEVEYELPLIPNEYNLPYRADPWAAVARSQVDPFSKINFDCGANTQSLLHHFAWIMPSIMDEMVAGTNFHRIGWLYSCVAVHDPTPVHVILGFTLAHIAQCHGEKEPPLAIEHKNRALQLINARMKDPVEALSNATIGAVVNIAGYELVDSNPKSFALHMTGLYRLLRERGGMATLRDNPELEDVIVRLDVLRAYIAISNPRYPDYSIVRDLHPLAINIPPSATGWNPLDYSIDERKDVYRFCEDSIYLVHSLEDFMLLIGSASKAKTEDLEPAVARLIASAAWQLLSRHSLGLADPLHLSRKCCRLATLIFVDLAIRELFDSPLASGHFVRELKLRLLGTNMSPWARSLEMLVMVLIKHDRIALEKAWRAWYIADVVTMTMNLGEETWMMAERKMLEYIRREAIEAPLGPRSSLVWNMQAIAEGFINEWS